ncbi:hypothetical protein LIA77_00486 [Sarocladium implicatum]|nr:hypothetical protein LIA77_00486 [Sarocladium implicatum]
MVAVSSRGIQCTKTESGLGLGAQFTRLNARACGSVRAGRARNNRLQTVGVVQRSGHRVEVKRSAYQKNACR